MTYFIWNQKLNLPLSLNSWNSETVMERGSKKSFPIRNIHLSRTQLGRKSLPNLLVSVSIDRHRLIPLSTHAAIPYGGHSCPRSLCLEFPRTRKVSNMFFVDTSFEDGQPTREKVVEPGGFLVWEAEKKKVTVEPQGLFMFSFLKSNTGMRHRFWSSLWGCPGERDIGAHWSSERFFPIPFWRSSEFSLSV